MEQQIVLDSPRALVQVLVILPNALQPIRRQLVGKVPVDVGYEVLVKGFLGEPGQKIHPEVEVGLSTHFVAHLLVVALDDLDERPHYLREKHDPHQHVNNAHYHFVDGNGVQVSVSNG